jgi:hypothetical protein
LSDLSRESPIERASNVVEGLEEDEDEDDPSSVDIGRWDSCGTVMDAARVAMKFLIFSSGLVL